MKLFPSLLILLFAKEIHAQTIKYKFSFPKREDQKYDTVSFRPSSLYGTYKDGEISFKINYEKDFPNSLDYSQINPQANALRQVSFQFEFFDSTQKILLNETTRFQIELKDGHAIPPNTEIIPFKYKIPEPYKVKFTWFYYDQPSLDKIREAYISSSSLIIDLYEYSKDYSLQKVPTTTKWGQTWSLR